MINLKRILVPTDFSEHAQNALRYGCEFAARFDSELHLVHVVEVIPVMYHEGIVFSPESEAQMNEQAAATLEKVPADDWRDRLNIVRSTVQGHPLVEIIRYAREADIDLMIIGTHGRTGLAHMLLGSNAEKIVRKAPCPVMTVHCPEHEFVMP